MRVTFSTEELKKRLAQLSSVIAKKAAQPVYGFVRLFAVQQEQTDLGPPKFRVGLSGVDIDSSLTVTLAKAIADEALDVLIPFVKLVDITSNVSVPECTIDATETKATFRAGKYRAELKLHPLADWPSMMERPENSLAVVGLPGFKGQIEQVEFAVPPSDGKFVVCVAKIESTEKELRFVATDGFRLVLSDTPQNYGNFELTVPKPALELIRKLDGTQLTISEGEAGFYFDTELETLTVSRSHGKFPNYPNILPKESKTVITVKKNTLVESIKRAKPLADSESPVIVFNISENGTEFNIQAASEESDSGGIAFRNMASDTLEATATGEANEFVLNVNLLLPFLEKAYGSADGDITIKVQARNNVVDFQAGPQYRFIQQQIGAGTKK